MAKRNTFKAVIGREITVDFPAHGVFFVPARVDTGAYRNALHATNIHLEGKELVFDILHKHRSYVDGTPTVRTKKYKTVTVENSFGHSQTRYEIPLKVQVGPKTFTSHFTLTDRSKKKYPILLGRILLNNRFIIDTTLSNIDRKDLETHGIILPYDEESDHSS